MTNTIAAQWKTNCGTTNVLPTLTLLNYACLASTTQIAVHYQNMITNEKTKETFLS